MPASYGTVTARSSALTGPQKGADSGFRSVIVVWSSLRENDDLGWLLLNHTHFHGGQSVARLTVSDRHLIAGFDEVGERGPW